MPKPKLTAEEKKAGRIQRKIERKKILVEKKKQSKRDHLEREVKYGAITLKKHEKEWRTMLVKISLPQMRKELEYAWHNFERVMDAKDFTISLLMDDIHDAEEQYMMNFKNHDENLLNLMRMYKDRVDELRKDNRKSVEEFDAESKLDVDNIATSSNDNSEYLKTMLYSLEVANKEQERMLRVEYYSRIDEEDVKKSLALQKLKGVLEATYQKLFDQTKDFLKDFMKKTRLRRKEHNALKTQDDLMQELVTHQLEHIRKSYEIIKNLKRKLADLKQVEGHKLIDLESEKDYFWITFLQLKTNLDQDRRTDMDHLIHLTKSSNSTFDFLEGLRRKGENILKLASICRKLETLKEKILPFPLPHIIVENTQNDGSHNDLIPTEDDDDTNMELFWQRYGNAGCVKYAIDEEKRVLNGENEVIVGKFKEYCDNVKYPSVEQLSDRCSKENVIEGHLEVRKYEKHMR